MEVIVDVDHRTSYEEAIEHGSVSVFDDNNMMIVANGATGFRTLKDDRVVLEFRDDELTIGDEGVATPGATALEARE